jgi:hypothetical protein
MGMDVGAIASRVPVPTVLMQLKLPNPSEPHPSLTSAADITTARPCSLLTVAVCRGDVLTRLCTSNASHWVEAAPSSAIVRSKVNTYKETQPTVFVQALQRFLHSPFRPKFAFTDQCRASNKLMTLCILPIHFDKQTDILFPKSTKLQHYI